MNPEHETVIIGAGIGGLGAAIGLKRAGLTDFIILERSAGIGGTWYNNHYPDVAVDVPGIVYQFSFAKNPNWSRTFPKGREVQQYIAGLVDQYRLNDHLRLGHEVMARVWDEDNHLWRLTLADGRVITSRFVITAVGAFVEPKVPDIAGLESFGGKVIQTQNWDHDYDLSGKRIAVIGTGATSVQLIPQMARVASHLDVYQRRAIWVFAKPDFPIPRAARWALKYIPGLQSLIRGIAAAAVEVGLVAITVYGKQIAPITLIPNWACRAFLFTQVRDRELRKKLTPEYGFGCKRPSVSNIYYRTFTQPHVDLVTDPIAEITPTGIVTRDGVRRDIDVLVLATGFEMSQSPEVYRARPVKGRNGFDLADYYENNRAGPTRVSRCLSCPTPSWSLGHSPGAAVPGTSWWRTPRVSRCGSSPRRASGGLPRSRSRKRPITDSLSSSRPRPSRRSCMAVPASTPTRTTSTATVTSRSCGPPRRTSRREPASGFRWTTSVLNGYPSPRRARG
ncbi:pyridine nucleotide-disulfide oxidoreductase family protein [Mycobacteroides abscessus subsp. bolletii 1513]|uniref:Pyridine nucleotide-disulfide oxidoreductase family protein n=1 Tax=Mycobacteroides abscessus subsp. bolletii 1513 TaxID=1299321 RepID=X8DHZ8_9MYCO|nr:pyridine nucleotide-disulfide oxidoreductase family protein [Mycobacteroides abscessus subsp. bolletii 1513]